MKHKILASFMFVGALAQIACDQSSQDKANACLSDPVCKAQVAQASGPMIYPLGAPAGAIAPVGASGLPAVYPAPGTLGTTAVNPLLAQPFRTSSAVNAAIKAQSAKVAAGLAADDANPWSPSYKAPPPNAVKSVSEVSAESSQAAVSREPANENLGSVGDLGEATR